MFGSIRGKITSISINRSLVEVGGLGFLVYSTNSFLSKIKVGEEVHFWTHTAVRENDISIYGFEKEEELSMFESLLNVSGIGPKSALAILSVAGIGTLEDAIVSGNTSVLTKIGGIGKKTADKIILELSGKIATSKNMSEAMRDDLDVFEALKALGYREYQITETLKEMPKDMEGANEKIKHALKILSKQ